MVSVYVRLFFFSFVIYFFKLFYTPLILLPSLKHNLQLLCCCVVFDLNNANNTNNNNNNNNNRYCVPESPRWLLARGKLQQLYSVVERAARMNGITLPANYQKSLEAVAPLVSKAPSSIEDAVNERSLKTTESAIKGNPLTVVFGRTYWRTTCLTLISWLSLIIIYFGLTLHLSNFGGDIYMNTVSSSSLYLKIPTAGICVNMCIYILIKAIAGTIEAISICLSIFVVLKFGIKRNLVTYMLIPGVCCLATNLVPKGEEYLIYVIALAMIGKMDYNIIKIVARIDCLCFFGHSEMCYRS